MGFRGFEKLSAKDYETVGLSSAPRSEGDGGAGETDWGEIFTSLVCHTSLKHGDILDLSIPQIEVYLERLGKHIEIKVGMPGMGLGTATGKTPPQPKGLADKPPKLSEIMLFAQDFNKVK